MPDIGDSFGSVARIKTTPTKGYQPNFSTSNTVFTDVPGLSLSVPNSAFFAVRGIFKNNAIGGTQNFQVLQGATVVFSDSVTSVNPTVASKTTDSLILQNTSGSSQTVKVQIKTDGTLGGAAIVNTMSLIQGVFVLPFDGNKYALKESWQDITSLDFVSCVGDGISQISFDGTNIVDSTITAATYSLLEKFCSEIRFFGSNAGYVAFDFSGKYVIF